MKQHIRLLLLVSVILSAAVLATAAQLSGPTLGYVWNGTDGQLHPLLGIPGNTTIGEGQDLGFAITQALALDGRHFLASTDASPSILSINLSAALSVTAIADAPASPSQAVGSRAGTAAALYYASQQQVLIVTGLPSTPRVSQILDVSAALPLSRMAVSDDGSVLLYSAVQGEYDALYGWSPLTGTRLLTTADSISDIALTTSGDVIVANAKANQVFSIGSPKGAAARLLVADDRSGISNPIDIAISNAGQIYVANGGSDTIVVLDPTGQILRTQQCGCELTGLFPLKDALYRLSDRTDGTLYLLEGGATGDRVLFVPPSRKNQ